MTKVLRLPREACGEHDKNGEHAWVTSGASDGVRNISIASLGVQNDGFSKKNTMLDGSIEIMTYSLGAEAPCEARATTYRVQQTLCAGHDDGVSNMLQCETE